MADWYDAWGKVEDAIDRCAGIAWDTCHKIYILMDEKQMAQMREYEYDPLISAEEMSRYEMAATVQRWFDESCSLRFVDAVKTKNDGSSKWKPLIEQGFGDYLEEDY